VDVPQLDSHQLAGLLLFLAAVLAGLVVPYFSARGVTALKRFVYQESSAGDELLVFDLLLFGMFGQWPSSSQTFMTTSTT
jgi:hypothetical protein